ncbi:hypothetical protein JI739_21680 [Ramlibacter sp. AW1]|uniref:Tetratricopeptide repeat protein n=1 Tax=Ramlibacter aurantiacus TaxID=2801330 RepID=A0A937D746_9BURK|nr:tetratricopeptide repeat protein [Ramlibacter aurantiacus]MBL0422962.1 hypothetical protein [Ramlibacter aurantiacus]
MNAQQLDISTPEGRLDAFLYHGVTPAQVAGITGEQLEAIELLAGGDHAAGRYDEAMERWAFLVQHDPWERRYQVGLAHTLQQLGQWEAAGRFFAQALVSDATDALCAYRAGECLGAMGDLDAARDAFETAIKLSWLSPAHAEVRDAAQARLDQVTAEGA